MTDRPVLVSGSADAVLRQVASWLLPGAAPIDPLADEAAARALVSQARVDRLLGPLLAAVDQGALSLPDDLVAEVVAGHEDSMRWCLQVEARLLEVHDWFEAAGGVGFRVVKGPAVAHLDEPDPSLRSFADLDLLVDAADMDRAIGALTAGGATRRIPERRPGFDRRFGKGVGMACRDLVEIDVHRTLCGGALGYRIPLERIFADAEPFDVGGTTFSAPILVHRVLHAAYHAIVGEGIPPLRTLRDLAGYLTHPHLTPAALAVETRAWRGEAVLALAARATLDALSFEAPAWEEWLEATDLDPAEVALIDQSRRRARWPVRSSTLRQLGWRDGAAFLHAVALPSPETLASQGETGRERVVRAIRERIPSSRRSRW